MVSDDHLSGTMSGCSVHLLRVNLAYKECIEVFYNTTTLCTTQKGMVSSYQKIFPCFVSYY
jgi:hypothetical protein